MPWPIDMRSWARAALEASGEDCRNLLHRGDLVEVNISEDPHYHVATDHADLGSRFDGGNLKNQRFRPCGGQHRTPQDLS